MYFDGFDPMDLFIFIFFEHGLNDELNCKFKAFIFCIPMMNDLKLKVVG